MLVGKTSHRATVGKPFNPAWEPTVLPDSGWVFIGWLDEHTGILHGAGATDFPTPIENRNYTFIAQYSNLATVHIEALTTEKVYDGTPLTANYLVTGLPTDCVIEGFTAEGSITNAGSTASTIKIEKIVISNAAGENVTKDFIVITHQGTLTVRPKPASVIAENAWKHIATADPGFNAKTKGFIGNEGPTAAQVKITRPGAGTDEAIGTYQGVLEVANNGYQNPNYIISWFNGDFEIINNPLLEGRVITVIGNSFEATYNSTPHIASGYSVDDIWRLAELGFDVKAVAIGVSAVEVNTSDTPGLNIVPAETVVVKLNGLDVTNLVEIETVDGELIINPRPVTITAASNSREYNGVALTDSRCSLTEGTLVDSQILDRLTVTGSQTVPGTCENIPRDAVILDPAANDVTDNYTITYLPGTLTVTPLQFEESAEPTQPEMPDDEDEEAEILDLTAPLASTPTVELTVTLPAEPPEEPPAEPPIEPATVPATAPTATLTAAPVTTNDEAEETEEIEITNTMIPLTTSPFPANPADTVTMDIEENSIPMASLDLNSWALWNLILSIAGAVLALLMGIRILLNKKREDEEEEDRVHYEDEEKNKRSRLGLILAIPFLAIVAIIIFILTQNMRLPMTYVDWWTLPHVILFIGGFVSYIFAYKSNREKEEEERYQPSR